MARNPERASSVAFLSEAAPLAWVTGAAGFIGRHLCLRLLQQGWRVLALDNLSAAHAPAGWAYLQRLAQQTSHLHLQQLDLLQKTALVQLPPPRVVFHLAARPGVRDAEDFAVYDRANVATTESLLAVGQHWPAVRVVFASSSSVYGEPLASGPVHENQPCAPRSVYGESKRLGETLIQQWSEATGYEGVCLRLFSVYGAAQRPDMAFRRWAEALRTHSPLVLHDPERMARDFTEVRDAVSGLYLAARYTMGEVPFACFNIGSGVQTALQRAYEQLHGAFVAQGIGAAAPAPVVREAHRAEVLYTWADLSCARAQLGYTPRYTLSTGLQDFAQAMVHYWAQGAFDHGLSSEY